GGDVARGRDGRLLLGRLLPAADRLLRLCDLGPGGQRQGAVADIGGVTGDGTDDGEPRATPGRWAAHHRRRRPGVARGPTPLAAPTPRRARCAALRRRLRRHRCGPHRPGRDGPGLYLARFPRGFPAVRGSRVVYTG